LEQQDLKFIIENSRNADNLTLYYCEVGRVSTINSILAQKKKIDPEELEGALNLNPNFTYNQKVIDFYAT